jgi:hypothetical protein
MNDKKCIRCLSNDVVKKGKQKNIQRWFCKNCKLKFQANRKPLPNKEEVFYSFTFNKQTLNELNDMYHIGTRKIQKLLDDHVLESKTHNPRIIYLVVDATYFGKRNSKNSFCIIVFRDPKLKEDLWWKFCDTEKESYYREGKNHLEKLGYEIKSVTADGLALIREAFFGIPYQMCHIHMERIIVRGTTKNPVLEASIVLLALIKTLNYTKKEVFRERMIQYTKKYINFINETALSEITGKRWFVHEELRKSYVSLSNLFPYLFTFKADTHISRTTNSLEGHFSMIKVKVATHHGLSLPRKQKIIEQMLLNSSASLHNKKKRK